MNTSGFKIWELSEIRHRCLLETWNCSNFKTQEVIPHSLTVKLDKCSVQSSWMLSVSRKSSVGAVCWHWLADTFTFVKTADPFIVAIASQYNAIGSLSTRVSQIQNYVLTCTIFIGKDVNHSTKSDKPHVQRAAALAMLVFVFSVSSFLKKLFGKINTYNEQWRL